MAAQLGEMAVGSTVKLNVGGQPTNFIVVHQGNPDPELYDESCNGTWLLMQDIYETIEWDDLTYGKNDYSSSEINTYLQGTFWRLLDADIQAAVPGSSIPVRNGNNSASTSFCRVFLLGGYEVGVTTSEVSGLPIDGTKLAYFISGTGSDAKAKRMAKFNGNNAAWWLRSPYLDHTSYVFNCAGSVSQSTFYSTRGVRPALIFPTSLFVNGNGFVVTREPPAAPASITVPNTVLGGGELLVSWAAASDPDGDPVSYELERKTDADDWAQIYQGEALSFTDQIAKGWLTVQYRVRAVDSGNLSSGWTESETRTVDNNTAPAIECEHTDGTDLGEKAEPFAVSYTVTDPDGDPLTLTETVDGQTTRTETEAESGAAFEAAVLGDPAEFQKLLNGPHTLAITASDGKARTTHTLTFTKKVTSASVTLSEPLAVEGDITLAALRVAGSIPEDALFTVEVTNNGNDDQPVWQDATAEVKRGANIVFTNHTAAKGAAFNFRVNVSRGPSGEGGYITAITGAFQ